MPSATEKTDRRVLRTRQSLIDSFITLVLEKDYAPVTIREITRRASVGYSTFFRHFKSKDDLTAYMCRLSWQKVISEPIDDDATPYDEMLDAFKIMQRQADIYRFCARIPRDHPAVIEVQNEIAYVIKDVWVTHSDSVVPIDALAHHAAAAIIELTRWWLENDMQSSPEQMAQMIDDLVVNTMNAYASR